MNEAERPAHVPPDRVVPFDIYSVPNSDEDIQLAFRAFQQNCPDIFWTPANGGHWVATRADLIEQIQKDPARFSHRRITLPPMPDTVPKQIPLELDPPVHGGYRRPLMQSLLPKIINALEPNIRQRTIELIEGFLGRGECEFIEEFAGVLPVSVFLEMVSLPQADRDFLREIAERATRGQTNEVRVQANSDLGSYLAPYVSARREQPGDDLLSTLVNTEIDGTKIPFEEAMSFAILVMFGGLDTVASMLGFVARFLALNPGHRREIVERLDDAAFLRHAIEELVRRHGIANTARVVVHDTELDGVQLKAGDMILPPNMLVGLDERRVEDPLRVDFARPFPIRHAAFGNGAHTCPGAVLARRELQVFLEEWLRRIPDFEVKPGTKPVLATGMVNGVLKLELVWPSSVRAAA
jgi:cytochrome P450